jgi:ribosomal silencing factor RsfS
VNGIYAIMLIRAIFEDILILNVHGTNSITSLIISINGNSNEAHESIRALEKINNIHSILYNFGNQSPD